MPSCIKYNRRGTALIETMLVIPVAVIFFYLILWVLLFWQDEQIDRSVSVAAEVARFNNTTGLNLTNLPFEYTIGGTNLNDNRAKTGVRESKKIGYAPYYCEEISNKDNKYPQHTKLKYYVTDLGKDNYLRRVMFVRGTNTWLSYPYIRGKHGKKEQEWQRDYLKKQLGKEKVDSLRKPLQLGS